MTDPHRGNRVYHQDLGLLVQGVSIKGIYIGFGRHTKPNMLYKMHTSFLDQGNRERLFAGRNYAENRANVSDKSLNRVARFLN